MILIKTAEAAENNYAGYGGDFENGLCSLKYSKICTKDLYSDMIKAGHKFCQGGYAAQQFTVFMNEMFAMGKIYEKKYGVATSHMTGNTYDRYGAECAPEAGAVPCNLIDFHNVESPQDLVDRVKALLDHVMEQCSATYAAKWEAWYV